MPRRLRTSLDPNRPLREDAYAALMAAYYHLKQIEFFSIGRGLKDQRGVNLFHAHLRAFFWELYAVRDVLKADRKCSTKVKGTYEVVNSSRWFGEVSAFRHHAHQSFHLVQRMWETKSGHLKGFMIEPVHPNGGQVGLKGLVRYWNRMRSAVNLAYPPVLIPQQDGAQCVRRDPHEDGARDWIERSVEHLMEQRLEAGRCRYCDVEAHDFCDTCKQYVCLKCADRHDQEFRCDFWL